VAEHRRGGLEDDRVSERVGRRHGLVRRVDQAGLPNVDAVRDEQPRRLLAAQGPPVGSVLEDLLDELCSGRAVDADRVDRVAPVSGPPLAVPGRRRQGAHRVLRHGVGGDDPPVCVTDRLGLQALVHPGHPEERGHAGLVTGARNVSDRGDDLLVDGLQRWDEAGEDAVDLRIREGRPQRLGEPVGRGVGRQRDRTVGDLEVPAQRRLGGQGAERVRVAHDSNPLAGGQRLVDEQLRDIEELVHVLDPDDARLAQHRAEGAGRHPSLARPVAGRGAIPGHARRDGDDRLALSQGSRDAGELARVADRLEVQADGHGAVVVDPVLQEVVARDVDPVAGGGEVRHPEAPAVGRGEHGDSQRATLREEAETAGPGHPRRERGVETDLRVGVDEAERVGADHAHPVLAGAPAQLLLALRAVVPALREPTRRDEEVPDALGRALVEDAEHTVRRDGDHG